MSSSRYEIYPLLKYGYDKTDLKYPIQFHIESFIINQMDERLKEIIDDMLIGYNKYLASLSSI